MSHVFSRTTGRVRLRGPALPQMPSCRGKRKILPQFSSCCQGSLLSQAVLFFWVWVFTPGGDFLVDSWSKKPFSVLVLRPPTSTLSTSQARADRRPPGALGLCFPLTLAPLARRWQLPFSKPSPNPHQVLRSHLALADGAVHWLVFPCASGDPGEACSVGAASGQYPQPVSTASKLP